MRVRNPYRDRPLRRSRRAEVPRLRRGRQRDIDACRARDYLDEEEDDELEPRRPRRSRKYNRASLDAARIRRRAIRARMEERRALRSRRSEEADENMMDLELDDLDSILEVPEDEIEEVEEPECPAGCVSEDKVDEALEEGEGEEEGEEDEGEEGEEEDEKEKEASVEAGAPEDVVEAAVSEETEEATEVEAGTTEFEPAEAVTRVETAKWAPLFTEADVKKLGNAAEVVLVPFFDQEDPSYVVLANARPVGEVRMSDLVDVDAEDRYALFTSEAFPQGIVQAAEQLGAANVLSDLGLRYFANLVTQKEANAAAKSQVQADLEEVFQTKAASLKQDFLNNVMLAVEASNKNLFVENPLRDEVRNSFRNAGVPDAVVVDLFEDAMQKAGAKYFIAMIEQADEWLGFEKEALAQIESTIKNSSHRDVVATADVYTPPQQRTVPVRTMAPAPQREAKVDEWSGVEDAAKNLLRKASAANRGSR